MSYTQPTFGGYNPNRGGGSYTSPKRDSFSSFSSYKVGRTIKDLAMPLGIIVVVLFVLSFISKKMFGKTAVEDKFDKINQEDAQSMTQYMRNGMTYSECALRIVELIFRHSVFAWWKSTDTDELGRIMLTVNYLEWNRLQSIYPYVKDKYFSDVIVTFGTDGTLLENLKSTFSSAEQKKYLTHLMY